jgi:hypothetical protein
VTAESEATLCAGGAGCVLDEPANVLVRQPIGPGMLAIVDDAPKQGAVSDARELQPRLRA